jgi:glycosyltransferase involved in cell wall biosynthesis
MRLRLKSKDNDDMRILITVPTWNEAVVIERNLGILSDSIKTYLPEHDVIIEVADNGSTDKTREIIRKFCRPELVEGPIGNFSDRSFSFAPLRSGRQKIQLIELSSRGKGLAIRRSWEKHLDDADVLIFMDADLAADLSALPSLIMPIIDGIADLVCGSRFVPGAVIERSRSRELASRSYRWLQKIILNLPVRDAQCGFKAISSKAAKELLPQCRECGWLFDTELIALANTTHYSLLTTHYSILEIPVSWIEHRNPSRRSAIRILRHGWGFATGLVRIRLNLRKNLPAY